MKILHVLHSLDPRSGGPSESLREIVRHQSGAGHAVSVITTDAQSVEPWRPAAQFRQMLRDDPRLAGAELFIARSFGRRRPLSRYSYSPQSVGWMKRRFANLRTCPDVVHIHGVFSHLTGAAACLSRRYGIPYVIRPAGSLNQSCLRRGSNLAKQAFLKFWLERDVRFASWIHATSTREANEITAWLPASRVEVIPHGISVPPVESLQRSRELFAAEFPHLQNAPFVLYMSRINQKKRLDLLVEAFAAFHVDHPAWRLVVAGTDDGFETEVRERVERFNLQRSVHFLGFLQGPLKEGALASAQMLALTSEDENFGVIVVEAMAHACPVLLTEGVDSHIHVDVANAGITVACKARDIHEGLRRMIAEDLNQLGRNGKRYVEHGMSWKAACEKMQRNYRLVLTPPGSSAEASAASVQQSQF